MLLQTYWKEFVFIVIVLGGLYWLFKSGRKKIAFKIILRAVEKADEQYDSPAGKEVFDKVYAKLPLALQFVLSDDEAYGLINQAIELLKQELRTE